MPELQSDLNLQKVEKKKRGINFRGGSEAQSKAHICLK
jgi:hypothetical protein